MHIFGVIFIKSILQLTHISIQTLLKDFQYVLHFEETPLCRYRAYLFISIVGILFWNYGLLAFFSFVRVIYPTKLWLHRSSTYIYILIPGEYLCIFIGLIPSLFISGGFHLISNEAFCGFASIPIDPSLYMSVMTQRDLRVIRRMFFNIIILSILAVPYLILYIISAIENDFGSILYRVQWISFSAGSCLLAVILPFVSTRLRDFLRPNKLRPENH